MTQEGVVTKVFENGLAEVAVLRTTACGSNCGNCESCIYQTEIKSIVRNGIKAQRGQHVVIESKTSLVFRAAALVYVMPLLFFVLGYAIAYVCKASEGVCILTSFLGLAVGAILIIVTDRLKKGKTGIDFDIVQLLN